jgi:hypothetical protein
MTRLPKPCGGQAVPDEMVELAPDDCCDFSRDGRCIARVPVACRCHTISAIRLRQIQQRAALEAALGGRGHTNDRSQ